MSQEIPMSHDRTEGNGEVFTASIDQSQTGFIEQLSVNLGLIGGGPGPSELIAGDEEAGYFGTVSSSNLIDGNSLASELGITQGTSINSTTDWLKFALDGKTVFVTKKSIRHSISWETLYLAGAVYGDGLKAGESGAEHHNTEGNSGTLTATRQDAQVTIDGNTYTVRLLKGVDEDPTNTWDDADSGAIGPGNEWNKIMLPIHTNAPDSWNNPEYVDNPTEDWGIGFTDSDLVTHYDYGDGSRSWCQETRDTDTVSRVTRGSTGVSDLLAYSSDSTYSTTGWRPTLVLES